MKRDEFDDELDLEEERYFNDLDFDEEEFIEDLDAPPIGDFDDDELLEDITDDDALINDNFLFGDDESYEDEINNISVDVEDRDDDEFDEEDFENNFFSKDEDEWEY